MIYYQINCSNVGVQCDIKPESPRIVIEEEPKEEGSQIDSHIAISPQKQLADLDKLMFSIMHGHQTNQQDFYEEIEESSEEMDEQSEMLRLPSHIKLSPRVARRNSISNQKGLGVLSINKIEPKTKKMNILSMYQKAIKAGKMGGTLQDLITGKKLNLPL